MKMIVIPAILILFTMSVISISSHNHAYADFFPARLSQTIASENHVYVTWDLLSNGKISIMFTQSPDYGNTFGTTIKISDDAGIGEPRKMAASQNHVYLAWGTETGHKIFLKKSSDYGNTLILQLN